MVPKLGTQATFTFKLEQTDGTPADPPQVRLGVCSWKGGETIHLGADRSLRVVEVRDEGDDEPVVLVVEDAG